MRKYFKVLAKCGHVGKGYYYEGAFYVKSDDAKKAAAYVRTLPRVKHDHKDAILNVEEITKEEYEAGKEAVKKEAYFNCLNSSEQKGHMEEISLKLKKEERKTYDSHSKTSNKKVFNGKTIIRKPKQYVQHYKMDCDLLEYAMYA